MTALFLSRHPHTMVPFSGMTTRYQNGECVFLHSRRTQTLPLWSSILWHHPKLSFLSGGKSGTKFEGCHATFHGRWVAQENASASDSNRLENTCMGQFPLDGIGEREMLSSTPHPWQSFLPCWNERPKKNNWQQQQYTCVTWKLAVDCLRENVGKLGSWHCLHRKQTMILSKHEILIEAPRRFQHWKDTHDQSNI